MAAQKDFVKDYMSSLPYTWDDVKFIDGYPGKYVVLARRKGNDWYIAGINGEKSERKITLNVPFINKSSKGFIITDSDDSKNFSTRDIDFSSSINLTMQPYGGFVIKAMQK
jgi:hypothetical protein